jgi:hypothetical protein
VIWDVLKSNKERFGTLLNIPHLGILLKKIIAVTLSILGIYREGQLSWILTRQDVALYTVPALSPHSYNRD